MMRNIGLLWLLAGAAIPFILPGEFYLGIATQILVFGLFAVSVNILAGFGGMVSLGHAGFLGVAAYSYALLVNSYGVMPLAAALLTLLIGTAVAAVFGLIALRTKGLSFLMITLALGQIVWGVAFRYTALTNGDNGINLSSGALLAKSPLGLYYLCIAVLCVVLAGLAVFVRSPLGAALNGVRDQPRRMSTLGYNTWAIRYVAYVLSGTTAALAGILYIQIFRFISPHALSLTASSEGVLMVIAGGIGTLFGPVLGAAIVVLLKNVASAYTDRWPTLLGLIFLFIILVMPEGLLPGARRIGIGLYERLGFGRSKQRQEQASYIGRSQEVR
ncbi:branched-chain amino acid ABC transporter permease [Brucella sp. NM4]|uniref:branched-chain amino acid ABC transporter permease n=1 Tax=Brucella sp. NM4 TaxID=3045175 RepID=UPI0024BC6A7A|nr:branched-chain amino acid ABC transporter permease [Brucella sp. NM4]WHS33943.1 branched-chain amino acid ABC transporter permease [Brucella sp. NM4]